MPDFALWQWMLAVIAAFCAGVSKAGLAGVGLLTVLLMAEAVPGVASVGLVLPLLIFADVMAAAVYRQRILWTPIMRLAGPVMIGIVAGWCLLPHIAAANFRPVIGWLVVAMLALQLWRMRFAGESDFAQKLPHSLTFAWFTGILTGVATMIANAAGPIATIYLLILALPKAEYIATMAWLFLFVNLAKVPFAINLGLINPDSFQLNLRLIPAVVAGLFTGRALVNRIPPKPFQRIVLALAAISALRLILA